jgi:hypothetical protein
MAPRVSRARWLLLLTGLLASVPGLAGQAAAGVEGRASIAYLSGNIAYLDAGREDGLDEGMHVSVWRAGQEIGALRVTYLASHRAACEIVTSNSPLAVGDSVAFAPKARPSVVASADSGDSVPRPRITRPRSSQRLRGRVGLRYLLVQPIEGPGFTQPAVDFRLDGTSLGGSPFGLMVDVRARQTYRTLNDGTSLKESRTVVYQGAVTARSPGGPRITVGRQYLPTVSSVSLFDGALAEYQRSKFGIGVFAGSEPEPASMGYSTDIRSYGLFLEGRSAPGSRARWSLSGGALGSYAQGTVNREFAFLQASLSTPGITVFVAEELDVNRAWKAEAGEPAVSLTSTFATLYARPASWLSLQAGFDNRRNVRLYRDMVNPETVFDDSFRQGVWGGASFNIGRHGRIGGDARASLGGADSVTRTRSLNGYAAIERLSPLNVSLRARLNRYLAVQREGWLQSLALGLRPAGWLGFEASGGVRRETLPGIGEERRISWYGMDLDVGIGRSFYVLLSGSRERGVGAAGDQLYGSLSYRF